MSGTLKLAFVIEAIDNATAKLRQINRAVEEGRKPWLKVRASAREFFQEAGWGKLQRQMDTIRERGTAMAAWGRRAASSVLWLSASSGTAYFGITRLANGIDRVNDTAQALGMTTQRFQRLGFAAQMNGSSVDEMGQSLVFLNKNMAEAREGNKEMVQWMRRAGITAADLKNRNFSAADAVERIADTFKRVGDKGDNAQRKIALTTQLMGRQGFRMTQLLNGGSEALREFYGRADATGQVLSDNTVRGFGEFNDSLDTLKGSLFGALATALTPASSVLKKIADRTVQWTAANRLLITTKVEAFMARVEQRLPAIATGLGQVMDVLGGFLGIVGKAVDVLGGWGNALKIVGALIALKFVVDLLLLVAAVAQALPVLAGLASTLWAIAAGFTAAMAWPLLFAAVLGGAAYIIWDQWGPISDFFSGLWEKVKSITSSVGGVLGFGSEGSSVGSSVSSPGGRSAIPVGGVNRVGGELRIAITGAPARVESLRKTAGSLLDLAVDTGPAMSGAY
jgi:hypothetical protein